MLGNPAGESLVGVGGADIEERVAGLRCEHLRNHSFNRRVLANVTGREINWNDGRRLASGSNRIPSANKSG